MKLFPQDLRAPNHIKLVRTRAQAGMSTTTTPPTNTVPLPEPKLGMLGRLWVKGLGLTDQQAAVANGASADATQVTAWMTSLLGSFFTGMACLIIRKKTGLDLGTAWAVFGASAASLTALGFGPLAQLALRSLHRPIQAAEMEGLIKASDDALESAYLKLVRDAILIDVPTNAETDIRQAIAALGEAIDRLPAVSMEVMDVTAVRAEATTLRQQAIAEPDRVTSDSLDRRADALERRADAYERSALLTRRAAALHEEILAQIETMRSGLAGHQIEAGVGAPTGTFAQLSESARRVAQEAATTADARNEVEQVLVNRAR